MKTEIDPSRMLRARPVQPGANGVLDDAAIASWRERGFAFVSGLFGGELMRRLFEEAAEMIAPPGSDEAETKRGFGGNLVFPSTISGLNEVTLHPNLLGAVTELLGTRIQDVRLTQSDLWPKYGRADARGALDNQDQRIHVDFPNHTLVHPAPWESPEAVEMIVYLCDIDGCGGPTAVVPREGSDDPAYRWPIVDTPGVGELDYLNDKESAETFFAERRPGLAEWRRSLYERERYVDFRRGDVLFYRHDTWHRGTPMIPGALRLVHNLTFRRAECEWISTLHKGWSWSAYSRGKFFERLLADASLDQRAVLGFPQPGSSYWNDATIAAVEARHGPFGMDMTPYREALAEV